MSQQRRFERQGPDVLAIGIQGVVGVREGSPEVAPERGDLGHFEVARVAPGAGPRGLGEPLEGVVRFALRFQRQTQVVERLAVLGRGVAVGGAFEGFAEVLLGLGEATGLERVDAQGGVDAHVAGVALESFLPVRIGLGIGGVKLRDAQAGQIELLVGLHLRRRREVRHGSRLVFGLELDRRVRDEFPALRRERGTKVVLVRAGGQGHFLDVGLAGVDGGSLLQEDLVLELERDVGGPVIGGGVEPDANLAVLDFKVDRGLGIGVLDASDVPERIPELGPAPRLMGRHPTVIRLIIGISADHQLDVRAVGVGEKSILQHGPWARRPR